MQISRREFLKLLGISGLALGGASQLISLPDTWKETLETGPRIESWKVSTCTLCPAGCGIRVRLIDGIPVGIRGNPLAPTNRGALCPLGQVGLELLYHPDRLLQPLLNTGEKGKPVWKPLSWDEAFRHMKQALAASQDSEGKVTVCHEDRNTLNSVFLRDLLQQRNDIQLFIWRRPYPPESPARLLGKAGALLSFNLLQADRIYTLGLDLLEEPFAPAHFHRQVAEYKALRPHEGWRWIHFSPRQGLSGKNANEWVHIRPDTYGILLLGLIHILLRDGLYDRRFFRLLSGKQKEQFRNFAEAVQKEFYPEKVENWTGVPASSITELARDLELGRSPLILFGGQAEASTFARFHHRMALLLNLMSGSMFPGGPWQESPAPEWVGLNVADGPSAPSPDALPHWLSQQKSAPGFVFLTQGDPLYDAAVPEAWQNWLKESQFVVQSTPIINDTSRYADLILPAPTYLESWELALPLPGLPVHQVGLAQPVVAPFGHARPFQDVLIQLLEPPTPNRKSSRPQAYRSFVQTRARQLFKLARGTPYFEAVSLEWLKELEKRGWNVYSYPRFSDFWALMREKGGWWDPEAPRPLAVKQVPSSLLDADWITRQASLLKNEHITIHSSTDNPSAQTSRFRLYPFITLFHMTAESAACLLLQELAGLAERIYWNSWAEIHPDRGKELGLKEGDWIRVRSNRGEFEIRVRFSHFIAKDVLAIPYGMGHTELGRYASGVGKNPIRILKRSSGPIKEVASWYATEVSVEKVKNSRRNA